MVQPPLKVFIYLYFHPGTFGSSFSSKLASKEIVVPDSTIRFRNVYTTSPTADFRFVTFVFCNRSTDFATPSVLSADIRLACHVTGCSLFGTSPHCLSGDLRLSHPTFNCLQFPRLAFSQGRSSISGGMTLHTSVPCVNFTVYCNLCPWTLLCLRCNSHAPLTLKS